MNQAKVTRKASGFVLVACLWMLTILTLAMGFIAAQSAAMQDRAFQQTSLQQWRFDRQATLSTLLYLGATQRVSYAGLTTAGGDEVELEDEFNPFSGDAFRVTGDELKLDDRPYTGIGGVLFSLQDAGSLIGLRTETEFRRLDRLLERLGAGPSQRRRLIASLKDYIDRDELESLDGIEAPGYRRLGMASPTNRFLVSPTQLTNVAGWSVTLGENLRQVYDEVTVHSGNKYNFNTLTPGGMEGLDDFDVQVIERVLQHRQSSHFRTLLDVNRVAGVLITADELAFSSIPDVYMRVKLWHREFGREERLGIRFTPTSPYAPWEIDYNVAVQRQITPDSHGPDKDNEQNSATASSPAIFR